MTLFLRHDQKKECKESLRKISGFADPIWGFYVYGTYTRPQVQGDAGEGDVPVDNTHFQEVFSKYEDHALDSLSYGCPAPYDQRLMDTLRLEPACYMPNASFDDVCNHFRENYATDFARGVYHQPDSPNADIDDEECSSKWLWFIVIDDEALKSREEGPDPIGDTPPEGADYYNLAVNAENVFVKILSASYTTTEKPVVLTAKYRDGSGGIQWNGWFKVSPVQLRLVFQETENSDDMVTIFLRGRTSCCGLDLERSPLSSTQYCCESTGALCP